MFLKKLTVFILLGIFLFNTAGYFITFKVLQSQIKKEVKREIKRQVPNSELTVIEISKKQLQNFIWEEEGKEFYHQGNLYDIVRSDESATSFTYYCISDKQEEALFENLDDYIDNNIAAQKSTKSSSSKKTADSSLKLYFNTEISFSYCNNFIKSTFVTTSEIYSSVCTEISSPPPEIS